MEPFKVIFSALTRYLRQLCGFAVDGKPGRTLIVHSGGFAGWWTPEVVCERLEVLGDGCKMELVAEALLCTGSRLSRAGTSCDVTRHARIWDAGLTRLELTNDAPHHETIGTAEAGAHDERITWELGPRETLRQVAKRS